MTTQAYQVLGNTHRIDGAATPGTGSIAPVSGGFTGSTGPVFVKVENTTASTDLFINFSTTNPSVTATVPVVGTPGTGVPLQHGQTAFIQVASGKVPATVYFAVAAASGTGHACYFTPVTLI